MFRKAPPVAVKNGHKNHNGGNGNLNSNGNGNQRQPHIAPANVALHIETVLGAHANFTGALTSSAGVRIDGGFDGTIDVEGPLFVGETARVVAEIIRAKSVSVAGSVKGNIVADKVEILSTGRIYGDLDVQAFVTEEGAILRGNVTMRDQTELEGDTRPVAMAGENGRNSH